MADDIDALMGAALPEISAAAIKVLDEAPSSRAMCRWSRGLTRVHIGW